MSRQSEEFPECVTNYITEVVRKIRYRRKIRREVSQELMDHFADGLGDCKNEAEKQKQAENMIANFGEAEVLAKLIRRGKKRCRPLWQKVMNRTVQAVAAVYVISVIFNVWYIHTWSSGSDVNYLEKINQLIRPETQASENAAFYYEKAAELVVEQPKDIIEAILTYGKGKGDEYDKLSPADIAAVEAWLKANEPAWEQILAAAKMENCWWEYSSLDNEAVSKAMVYLRPYRSFARLGTARAQQQVLLHEYDAAVEECYTVLRLGQHMSGNKLLVEHLVGIACIFSADRFLLNMLDRIEADKTLLESMQDNLQDIFPNGYPLLDIQVELSYSMGSMQNMYSQNGTIGVMGYFMLGAFIVLGNREHLEERLHLLYDNLYQDNPYDYQLRPPQNIAPSTSVAEHLIEIAWASLERSRDINYRNKAEHEALVTVIALQRWRLDKGMYPDTLAVLQAEDYLEQLPDDPYGQGPLCYERRGDDFILYSVGADFDDDGGKVNPEYPWADSDTDCDRVFWPMESGR